MDELGLYDIYDLSCTPWWQLWQVKVAGLAVVAILLIIIVGMCLYRYLKGRRKNTPYWIAAQRDIQKITTAIMVDQDAVRQQYHLLTGVFKKYLIIHYQIKVHGMTDQELIASLQANIHALAHMEKIKEIFDASSMIRFARNQAGREQLSTLVAQSLRVIEQTISEKQQLDR